ncbi:metallophosphoesterase family protein [Sporosarcina aquimarina]|uniref:Metallophosphoesterase family protein n=1 Tax=Sporosarcina aquimarina TaxID=114975 RepID=A0ABU4FY46_9BACL|nr:metallophosphoesterase family protein [Sporosarcina aquimarina]MDW0109037.1 metallophosphoesterase family protein [Sporosarcina aquimarina]
MRYALVSDIHSSEDELKQVLQQIEALVPDAVVGLGDLFECTIGKKKLDGTTYLQLNEVMLNSSGFESLLTFPSIRGNQEERIAIVSRSHEPLLQRILDLPEQMRLGHALLIHGHQWPYNENPPSDYTDHEKLVFHGHTHKSSWSMEGCSQSFEFGEPIDLSETLTVVNVGSVIDNKEWLLYDDYENTITFMKAD